MITGPSGVGKGTLIRTLLERMPELELSVSATTRGPRPGEEHGVHYHFLDDAEFERRVHRGRLRRARRVLGPPLRHAALRAREAHRATARRSCSRSRSRAPARSRETMPEAVRIFIAPPSEETLRTRLIGRGTDDPEQVERRLRVAKAELAASGRVPARRAQRPPRRRGRGARADRARRQRVTGLDPHGPVGRLLSDPPGAATAALTRQLSLSCDFSPRRPPARACRLPVRERDRRRQACASDQLVLPQPRRGHVRGVPAADGRHGAPRTT